MTFSFLCQCFLKMWCKRPWLPISSWNILKTCIRGLIPNQMNQNLLLVGGWPCWLLFTISPERHCSVSVVNKPWLPGQRNNYRSTGTQPYGFVYLLSVAALLQFKLSWVVVTNLWSARCKMFIYYPASKFCW